MASAGLLTQDEGISRDAGASGAPRPEGDPAASSRPGSQVDGAPRTEESRELVLATLQDLLETIVERWGRLLVCTLVALLMGMLGVLVWSQTVYEEHKGDGCDVPLAFMLRLICIIAIAQVFQRELIRTLLCYEGGRDNLGEREPCRVRLFRRSSILAVISWPAAAMIMLSYSRRCSSSLVMAVKVLVAYYAVFVFIVIILPAFVLPTLLFMIRRGWIRAPRHGNAAPDDLIERLPQVAFDPSMFSEEASDGYPSACPICLDLFSAERQITRTPCGESVGHAFHTECLRGWLRVARGCPLCRTDLLEAMDASGEEGRAGVTGTARSSAAGRDRSLSQS